MPRDLLAVEAADLPSLGVPAQLAHAAAELAARDGLTLPSAAILGSRDAGTTAVLMVLARKVGAALRDYNIRLRDGGDVSATRLRLCYLPGAALPEALASVTARRTLESEAALFLADLDDAWTVAGVTADLGAALLDLLASRDGAALRTFVSADPTRLPESILRVLGRDRFVVLHAAIT